MNKNERVSPMDRVTAEDRLRLHVTDPDTFGFDFDDAEALVEEIDALRSAREAEPADEETRLAQLEEIADGAWGDNPMVRGKARDMAAELRAKSSHPSPSTEGLGVEARGLVDKIAHKEQIGLWANEISTAISLGDFLKDNWSFDDSVDLDREITAQLRDILQSAFSHPEMDIAATITALSTQVQRLTEENEALRGLTPALPPYPPEGSGLPRFGLRWNGPEQPLAVPMEDGYWTPYHLASLFRRDYQETERELSEVSRAIGSVRWMDPPDGGDVSLGEQVSRMRADLEAAEAKVEALRKDLAGCRAVQEVQRQKLNMGGHVRAEAAEARIKALEEALRAVSDTSHVTRDRKHYRFPLSIMDKVDAVLEGSQSNGR